MREEESRRKKLEAKIVLVGYAMSRLNREYLESRSLGSWREAYAEAGNSLSRPIATFKNLRDEFDPFHSNPRKGWRMRPLRSTRQRVLEELHDVSDEALMALVSRVLQGDDESSREAIDSLAAVAKVAANVAERLLTGARAEAHFLENSEALIQVARGRILDLRQQACGFDFGIMNTPELAIEVKGLKKRKGTIQFTDREWREAGLRRANYWVIVVGGLENMPSARIFRDPHASLPANCTYSRVITASWSSKVTVG